MNAKRVLCSLIAGLGFSVSANAAEATAQTKSGEIHRILNLLAETAKKQHEQLQEIPFPPGDVDKIYVLLGREPTLEEMNYLADSWAEIKKNNPLFEVSGKDDENVLRLNQSIHDKREREYLRVVDQLKQKK